MATSHETSTTRLTVQRPLRRTDLTIHELDGEALIYDAASADTHRLNHSALFIWQQCDGRLSALQVAERLVETYDLPMDSAVEHVERILTEFQKRQLLVAVDQD